MNAQTNDVLSDWVSRLPDDILISIISRLTFREAVRTGVLSNRWKYLWTSITSLDFDASNELLDINESEGETLEEERFKYLRWVSKALESHVGSNIIKFRVRFDLYRDHKNFIDKWIYTAMEKEVQELELNLRQCDGNMDTPCPWLYLFSEECYNYVKSPPGLRSIRNLRSLDFNCVNVNGEILEFFIHNCPFLERLRVTRSTILNELKVVGSSIGLKYLEILHCHNTEKVMISTQSLLSFKFHGENEVDLNIENVDPLLDASIVGPQMSFFGPNRSFLQQLQTLELDLWLYKKRISGFSPGELPKLRHLTLMVSLCGIHDLAGLTRMINACLFLQKLTLKYTSYIPETGDVCETRKCSHQHLRVVELIGCIVLPVDGMFAEYVFETAPMLEKMIVEPWLTGRMTIVGVRRRFNAFIEKKVPERVEFVIRE